MNFQDGVKCYFMYNKRDIDPQDPVTIITRSFLNPYTIIPRCVTIYPVHFNVLYFYNYCAEISQNAPPVFGGVRVAHLFCFLCCVVLLYFVCLCPVSCVPNVASVSGLPNIDYPFDFLQRLVSHLNFEIE